MPWPDLPCLGGGRWLAPLGGPGVSARAYTIASPTPRPPTPPHPHTQPLSSPQPHPRLCSGQASDQGNTIYAIPYALRPIHGPPYPTLTIVIIPNILQEARAAPRRTAPHRAAPRRTAPHRTAPHLLGAQNIHSNCSIDPDAGTLVCNCDRYLDAGGSMDVSCLPPSPPPRLPPHPASPRLHERDGIAVAMHRLSPAPAPRTPRTMIGAETFRTRSWSPSGSPCR